MNRFKNILAVLTDTVGSDDVVEQATALAASNEAKLTLAAHCGRRGAPGWQEEMHKRLRRIASTIGPGAEHETETRVIGGSPSAAIVREVADNAHDLVIMSSNIGEPLSGALLGGTKRRLMKQCPCPVWFLGPGQQVPYKRVLAVVDPCLAGGDDRPLNLKITEIAASLAVGHGAELHLVHAWEVDGPDFERNRSELWPEDRERLIEEHLIRRRRAIGGILRSVPGPRPSCQIHLPRTMPNLAIRELATSLGIDLIVMRADGGYSLPFLPGGSMAETLLDYLSCSVLSVTPDSTPDRIPVPGKDDTEARYEVVA